jgi:hypothetical protein
VAKKVGGTVSLTATPSTVPAGSRTTFVLGDVRAREGCDRNRRVIFSFSGEVEQPGPTTGGRRVNTGRDGDFAKEIARPHVGGSTTLFATLDPKVHRFKGRKVKCRSITGQVSIFWTTNQRPPPVRPPRTRTDL